MANIELDGANKKITVDSGDLTLDIPGDIILDADGGDVVFADGGTNLLKITNSSSDVVLQPQVDAKDIVFKQYDGTVVATVEDNATFNVPTGKLAINGTAITSTAAELNILDGVTATSSELNLLDGGTSVGGSITLADADGVVVNDGGTMKTIPASDVKTYAGGSSITWKATSSAQLALDNQGDVGFTDLDLTSVTSANAEGVFLLVAMRNDTANEYAQCFFRKNGDTPTYPTEFSTDDSFGANVNHKGMVAVGCDTGQIIEYKIDTESSSSVSLLVSVLGYWE